jgi:hypothetical protein
MPGDAFGLDPLQAQSTAGFGKYLGIFTDPGSQHRPKIMKQLIRARKYAAGKPEKNKNLKTTWTSRSPTKPRL